jgi:hypothetical protein
MADSLSEKAAQALEWPKVLSGRPRAQSVLGLHVVGDDSDNDLATLAGVSRRRRSGCG